MRSLGSPVCVAPSDDKNANYSWLKGTKCLSLLQFGPISTSYRIAVSLVTRKDRTPKLCLVAGNQGECRFKIQMQEIEGNSIGPQSNKWRRINRVRLV